MQLPVLLDASAAVRTVMDAAAQPELLQTLTSAPLVLAPALMRVEAANALWKYHRAGLVDAAEAIERHTEIAALVHRFIDEQQLFPEALQLAAQFDHAVYDAVYVVSARRYAAMLLTFDRRLHALCDKAAVSSRLFTG